MYAQNGIFRSNSGNQQNSVSPMHHQSNSHQQHLQQHNHTHQQLRYKLQSTDFAHRERSENYSKHVQNVSDIVYSPSRSHRLLDDSSTIDVRRSHMINKSAGQQVLESHRQLKITKENVHLASRLNSIYDGKYSIFSANNNNNNPQKSSHQQQSSPQKHHHQQSDHDLFTFRKTRTFAMKKQSEHDQIQQENQHIVRRLQNTRSVFNPKQSFVDITFYERMKSEFKKNPSYPPKYTSKQSIPLPPLFDHSKPKKSRKSKRSSKETFLPHSHSLFERNQSSKQLTPEKRSINTNQNNQLMALINPYSLSNKKQQQQQPQSQYTTKATVTPMQASPTSSTPTRQANRTIDVSPSYNKYEYNSFEYAQPRNYSSNNISLIAKEDNSDPRLMGQHQRSEKRLVQSRNNASRQLDMEGHMVRSNRRLDQIKINFNDISLRSANKPKKEEETQLDEQVDEFDRIFKQGDAHKYIRSADKSAADFLFD